MASPIQYDRHVLQFYSCIGATCRYRIRQHQYRAEYDMHDPYDREVTAMTVGLETLTPFQNICKKICLNIPDSYRWEWDKDRNMAVIILEEDDAEMVFYPLFKEFQNHWNFTSIGEADQAVNEFVHAEFGLMPGQALFTSHMVDGAVLGVAWWPWGREDKVSMRVGLIPVEMEVDEGFVLRCLSHWLDIEDTTESAHP